MDQISDVVLNQQRRWCVLNVFFKVYIIGLGVSIAKKRKSVVDEELDSSDDSDEELVPA